MSRLNYVGPTPSGPDDVYDRFDAVHALSTATVSHASVLADVAAAAALKAPKAYIDAVDGGGVYNAVTYPGHATTAYMVERDLLNVPINTYTHGVVTYPGVGQPGGAATVVGGKIPVEQIPTAGAGWFKGPYGPTSLYTATAATTTPVKIAEFAIGVKSMPFRPMCWATVLADTLPGGQPIIEMRISNGAAAYGSQTLVAQGLGRTIFKGRQAVVISPASDTLGATNGAGYAGSYSIVCSLYVYSSTTTPVTVSSSSVISAGVFLFGTAT